MALPVYKVKQADRDDTVYEKVTNVAQVEVFTITELDERIARENEAITQAQARIVEIEADKTKALATKVVI